jgi:hypothetical protein
MADTLVCSIELSKTAGMTLTVTNSKDKITQTVVINGTTLVMTVKGEQSTAEGRGSVGHEHGDAEGG